MSTPLKWTIVAVVAVIAIIAATAVTFYVVDGGSPSAQGRITKVRIGTQSPGDDFHAYQYRTSSRFGEQVDVSVSNGTVYVTGPRLDRNLYFVFIGLQMLAWAAMISIAVAAVVFRRWRWLWWILAVFAAQWVVASLGAAALWELPNIASIQAPEGLTRVSFPKTSVRDVRIGQGWERNGLAVVIAPYVPAIDAMAGHNAVSFEAPSGDTGRNVVYALHFYTPAEATRFAGLLTGK